MADQEPTPPDNTTSRPKRGRGLRLALFASVALNVLIVGVIVGVAVSGGHTGKRSDGRVPVSFGQSSGPLIRALPEDSRRAFARNMRRTTRDAGLTRTMQRENMTRFVALLEQESLDVGALEAVLNAQRDGLLALQSLAQSEMQDQIVALSTEERRAMATDLRAFVTQGPRSQGGATRDK